MNRDLLSRRLERRGFEVLLANDGAAGLDRAAADHPDLILLDMDLPVMNGWDVAKTLRAQQSTSTIPIIALTAHALSTDRERALEAGCHDYETKPIDLSNLLTKIESLLGKESC